MKKKISQMKKLLAILRDKKEHSYVALNSLVGFRYGSLICTLRKRGFDVVTRRDGNRYYYRLKTPRKNINFETSYLK